METPGQQEPPLKDHQILASVGQNTASDVDPSLGYLYKLKVWLFQLPTEDPQKVKLLSIPAWDLTGRTSRRDATGSQQLPGERTPAFVRPLVDCPCCSGQL